MAGSNGGMGIEGPDSRGSSSSTLKLTTWRVTFSGGAFFIISTSDLHVTQLQHPVKGHADLKLCIWRGSMTRQCSPSNTPDRTSRKYPLHGVRICRRTKAQLLRRRHAAEGDAFDGPGSRCLGAVRSSRALGEAGK